MSLTNPSIRSRRIDTRRMPIFPECLEIRTLLAVSPEEMLFTYELNRARHNPVSYQQEQQLSVDLSYVTPRAPLALNVSLSNSSDFKADEMATFNYFNHQSLVTGQWPNLLARNNGYALPYTIPGSGLSSFTLPDNSNQIESLAAGYTTAIETLNALIVDAGTSPPGHRIHLLGIDDFNAGNREIGVGHAFNNASTYKNYWAIHATRDATNESYLTGVIFNDTNTNRRFNLNEGLDAVTITAAGPTGTFTTTTMAAGGWSLKVPAGEYIVTAAGAGFTGTSSVSLVVGNSNVAVDFISGISTGWVNFSQYVNIAPVLSTVPTPSLPPLVLGTPNPPGVPVSSLLIGAFSDVNPLSPQGIAITSAPTTGAGVWQYSTNSGSTWLNLVEPSDSVARLLRAEDLIRLLPSGSQATTATISYRAWDQSTGTAGGQADTAASGGNTAFSIAVESASVTTVISNTAPVLASTGSSPLSPVAEDALSPAGTTVAAILGSSFTDVDPGTPAGLAVTGITGSSNGVWSYSINGGTSWVSLASASNATAIPLRASDLLRFVPVKDFVGSATVTYRGWDQSTGLAGVAVNLASAGVVGGSTAYSVASASASIAVTPVNDAPTLLPGSSSLRFKPVAADTSFSFTGSTVADLLGNAVLDVDTAAKIGIAVVGVGANMTFWWNTGGSSWSGGSISATNALLLKETDTLGFAPNAGFTGTTTITFRLWDQTAGTPGWNGANLSNPSATTGGTTAFGSVLLTATLSIGPAGTAPTATFGEVTRTGDGAAVDSIPVTFSRSVEGLDTGDFVLTRNGVTVPLQNATLTGSGTSFVLGNLADLTPATGSYTLTIPATRTGITDTVGNRMTVPTSTTFSVTAVNHAPVAQASSVTTNEDTTKTFALNDFLFTDAEGDPLASITISSLNLASGDMLRLSGTNVSVNNVIPASQIPNLVYTPAANANGSARSTLTFSANDTGSGTVAATMTIHVTAINDSPKITSNGGGANAAINVGENQTAVTTVTSTDADTPTQSLTYSKTGGPDAAKFSITNSGVLRFVAAPDFENPTDADFNNTYLVQVTVNDGSGGTTLQNLTVTVTAANDNNPIFTSVATVNVVENSTAVVTVAASDADLPKPAVTFSITGGADQSRFSIASSGVLRFVTAPDFENPTDSNSDNVYLIRVMADDGSGGTNTQDLSIRVINQLDGTNENDAFVLTYSATAVAVTAGSTSLGTYPLTRPLTLNGLGGTDSVRIVMTSGDDVIQVLTSALLVNNASLILAGIENRTLAGAAGSDVYKFDADAALGLFTLDESGGGTDTIDLSLTTTVGVSVNLGIAANQVVHSTNLSLILGSATTFENAVGSSAADTLTGNRLNNTLTGGAGNDRLNGGAGSDILSGGLNDDIYIFGTAAAAEADQVIEFAIQGTDTLSFAGLTTSVLLSLGSNTVQSVHANRTLKLNFISTFENAIGGSADDTLTGNTLDNRLTGGNGNNILVGLSGSDILVAGSGRDILIGGLGLDTLNGGAGDDILIAGRTTSDSIVANLSTIRTQWISASSYAARVAALRVGVGSPNVSLKAKVNVLNDAGEDDSLTGGTDTDWYFRALDDAITDLVAGELIDVL